MPKTFVIRYFFTCPFCTVKNEGQGEYAAASNVEARDRALESIRCSGCGNDLPRGEHCFTTINEKR